MRILHLTSHLNVGGISSHLLALGAGLRARGHAVRIVSGGGLLEDEARRLGLEVWAEPLHTSAEFSWPVRASARRLLARLREEPVDLLHGHTRVGQVVAQWLSPRLRLPFVATWHGFFHPNPGRWLWPCTGALTIAISEPVRQHLVEAFRVPAARIRLIPHGIDTSRFEQPVDAGQQEALRRQLGLPPSGRIVGTVARLVASKGVDQLIRSLPAVRRGVADVRLLVVGDGEDRPRLERVAEDCGVRQAVHFAGALADTRVPLSLMDAFVFLPAREEGFGLALLEAMASARPIVAVRQGGGAPWVLEQSGAGRLVPPDDPEALAQALTATLQDREAACRAAGEARAAVKRHYSVERMVEQVEAVYQELVMRHGSCVMRGAPKRVVGSRMTQDA
jgi:glycosyltransferase involved in cell wall biosynthesis